MSKNFVSEALTQHKAEIKNGHYCCLECKSELKLETAKSQNYMCPKCGEGLTYRNNSTIGLEESRFDCPRCRSSFLFERDKSGECPVCSAYMQVFTPVVKNKKSK